MIAAGTRVTTEYKKGVVRWYSNSANCYLVQVDNFEDCGHAGGGYDVPEALYNELLKTRNCIWFRVDECEELPAS